MHAPPAQETTQCQYEYGTAINCGDAAASLRNREFYMLSAINDKLRYYPELARAIGILCVRDCVGARAFVKEYAEYSKLHPGFDADQPSEVPPPPPPPPPPP